MKTMTEKQKWIKSAFHGYYKNKARLPQLKADYDKIAMPGCGGFDPSKPYTSGGGGNGVEKSVLQYLADRERMERAITDCQNKLSVVEKTIQHFSIEAQAKGKRHRHYIECRFLRCMSYTRAAIECQVSERTTDFWLEEIYTVAYAIAEIERYF